MPAMTADAIRSEIDSRRERIRELTETEQALERSVASGRNAIARAIARGRNDENSEEAAAIRESVRTDSDRLGETKTAIALLERDCADYTAQLKKAEAREANERASQSAADARAAIAVVRAAVREAAAKIEALARAARLAMDQANSDDANAKSMNGLPVTGMGPVHFSSGLEDICHELHSFAHRQDVSPTGPPLHRVA